MACPRCDHPIVVYTLEGREASVCERCGYVGVTVEHRRETVAFESWEDALRRFRNGEG